MPIHRTTKPSSVPAITAATIIEPSPIGIDRPVTVQRRTQPADGHLEQQRAAEQPIQTAKDQVECRVAGHRVT